MQRNLGPLISRAVAVPAVAMACFGIAGPASAAPHVPVSDADVLEKLPARASDGRFREVRELRNQLNADPRNLEIALRVAQLYFDLAGAEGDPRYVGYAQAALAPWWSLANPPESVLVTRALLRQYRHEFQGALDDVALALERQPHDAQALALRAAISMVMARYDAAADACRALAVEAREVGQVCLANVTSLNADGRAGLAAMIAALRASTALPREQKVWLWSRAAETADRLDDAATAEKYYREALAFGLSDAYLEAAYADFLLDHNRPREVVALLKDKTRSDPLLLRLALAEKKLGAAEFEAHRQALAARFDAARQRGDKLHLGEEARFTLELAGDPPAALRIALENWADQREPRDARVVLETALAAKNPQAATNVLAWYRDNHIVSPRMARLIDALGAHG